jgi:hypothetical protein
VSDWNVGANESLFTFRKRKWRRERNEVRSNGKGFRAYGSATSETQTKREGAKETMKVRLIHTCPLIRCMVRLRLRTTRRLGYQL